MGKLTLTPTELRAGIWEGILTGAGEATTAIIVTHLNRDLPDVTLVPHGSGRWLLRIPIPIETLADGVQTYVVRDAASRARLGHFSVISGEALGDDLRAEVDLLRAELDLLKRAFRRHVSEAE